jgi:signal peptidase I
LAPSELKQLWKNEYFQTAMLILLVVVVVLGFWFGLRFALDTDYPMLAVASGSMCIVQPNRCDGWSHPFSQSLHTGDLIIVQGVNLQDIYAAPFNQSGRSGDILVFNDPVLGELIVHRAVGTVMMNGQTEFLTQGDGNAELGIGPGPGSPTPPERIVGKVVLRIPWIGHLALFLRDQSGVYLILAIIIIVIVVELALTILGGKKTQIRKDETADIPLDAHMVF